MAATARPETYDCIVVGSGMGGLTVASLLAQVKGNRSRCVVSRCRGGLDERLPHDGRHSRMDGSFPARGGDAPIEQQNEKVRIAKTTS